MVLGEHEASEEAARAEAEAEAEQTARSEVEAEAARSNGTDGVETEGAEPVSVSVIPRPNCE